MIYIVHVCVYTCTVHVHVHVHVGLFVELKEHFDKHLSLSLNTPFHKATIHIHCRCIHVQCTLHVHLHVHCHFSLLHCISFSIFYSVLYAHDSCAYVHIYMYVHTPSVLEVLVCIDAYTSCFTAWVCCSHEGQ